MVSEWRKKLCDFATAEVTAFVHAHSDFSIDASQPAAFFGQFQGGTNFVLWGHHGEKPVIFKYFHDNWGARRWLNEYACLNLFAPTGCVPQIHATVPERLIVMSCLPGRFCEQEIEAGETDAESLAKVGYQLGDGIGRFVNTPLPAIGEGYSIIRDYTMLPWNTDLCEAVRFYLKLCRRDQSLSAANADPFYNDSLTLVENQVDRISDQLQVIFHEDLHYFVHKGEFQGFFDLDCFIITFGLPDGAPQTPRRTMWQNSCLT
jgi:hypothetical protein